MFFMLSQILMKKTSPEVRHDNDQKLFRDLVLYLFTFLLYSNAFKFYLFISFVLKITALIIESVVANACMDYAHFQL